MATVRYECFVIQPFGIKPHPKTRRVIDNDAVYEALKAMQILRPKFPIVVSRADRRRVNQDELHGHIFDCIRKAAFCVADLTGQNPNVLYEIGIARGLGRRVVLICQDRKDVPTDLTGLITVRYTMDGLENLANDIDPHLDAIYEDVQRARQSDMAMAEFCDTRAHANIQERILRAERKIDILATNLSAIEGNYIPQLREALRKPAVKLRILTLDPQSPFVNYRGQQVGFGEAIGLYRQELDVTLRSMYFQLREFGNKVEIRVYDDFPTQIAFHFDDAILISIMTATGRRSRENCCFVVKASQPGAQKSFIDNFEHLWKNAQSYRPAAKTQSSSGRTGKPIPETEAHKVVRRGRASSSKSSLK